MNKTLKMILEAILTLLLIFFIAADVYWIYLKYFAPDSFTELTFNTSTVEDTNGKRAICQVAYYENKDGTGVELLDVKFNGYTDTNKTNISSFGVQVVGSFNDLVSSNDCARGTKTGFLGIVTESIHFYSFISSTSSQKYGQTNAEAGRLCFYQESDNLNYANVTSTFDDFGYLRIDIDGTTYAMQPCVTRSSYNALWVEHKQVSSLSEFVKGIYELAQSIPVGSYSKTFVFKDMFKLYEIKNGKYEDVSQQDEIFANIYIDITHYTTGATTANDSLFKQIRYDTNFAVAGATLLDEHFSDKNLYKLTEQDFVFDYSEELSGHVGTLNSDCYNYLVKHNISNIEIVIDLDYLNSIGVVYRNLSNKYMQELKISSYIKCENGIKSEVQFG